MTLLTVVRSACSRMSLPRPSLVIGSSDATTAQMLYLAQDEGKSLSRRTAWKALTSEKTFSTVATAAQTGAIPSDCDWIIPETMFNRTSTRPVEGPISPQDWQQIQSGLMTLVWPAFRIRGTSLLITPTPDAGDTVGYEYITKNWCQSSASVAQSEWTADTDTALLDEELHILGLIWRFRAAKRFDYSTEQETYNQQVVQAAMREGVRPRISPDGRAGRRGGDVLAGATPNLVVTDNSDSIAWD